MEKSVLKAGALCVVLFAFASCGTGEAYLDVVEGNYHYHQGRFAEATLEYLTALEKETYPEWISYNLGNVYHALGEAEAAFEVWSAAGETADRELRFRVLFNTGTLLYELGRYREAYEEFRKALRIDGTDIDAKINLELCLRKVQALSGSSGASERDARAQDERGEAARILEYIGRKEGYRWSAERDDRIEPDPRDW